METPVFILSGGYGCFYAPIIGSLPPGVDKGDKLWVSKVTTMADATKSQHVSNLLQIWDTKGDFHVKIAGVRHATPEERLKFPCKIRGRVAEGAIMQMVYGGISLKMLKGKLSVLPVNDREDTTLKLDKPFLAALGNIFAALATFCAEPRKKIFIHGDIKPCNILIAATADSQGLTCRLIDFDYSSAFFFIDPPAASHTVKFPVQGSGDPYVYWPPEVFLLSLMHQKKIFVMSKEKLIADFGDYTERLLTIVNTTVHHKIDVKAGVANAKNMLELKFDDLIMEVNHGNSSFGKFMTLKGDEALQTIIAKFDTWSLGITLLELLQKRSVMTPRGIETGVCNLADPSALRPLTALALDMINVSCIDRVPAQEAYDKYKTIVGDGWGKWVASWLSPSAWYKTLMKPKPTNLTDLQTSIVGMAPPKLRERVRAPLSSMIQEKPRKLEKRQAQQIKAQIMKLRRKQERLKQEWLERLKQERLEQLSRDPEQLSRDLEQLSRDPRYKRAYNDLEREIDLLKNPL